MNSELGKVEAVNKILEELALERANIITDVRHLMTRVERLVGQLDKVTHQIRALEIRPYAQAPAPPVSPSAKAKRRGTAPERHDRQANTRRD